MSEILNFVSEVFRESSSLSKAYEHYSEKVGVRKDSNDISDKEFFVSRKPKMLQALWDNAYGLVGDTSRYNKYSDKRYHYCKMSITKYIATDLDKIGKDKTFYFLGKRHTKVSDITKLSEHFGWKWEKKDPTKAHFFILGDNPSEIEARYNKDLARPVVMDDELRVQMHFLFNPEVSVDNVDNEVIAMYLNSQEYDHLRMVVSMIQYLKDGMLSPANKTRLIRLYVTIFTKTIEFNLNSKEHVWMSDTVQRYCHPQHRYLVTNNFLNRDKPRAPSPSPRKSSRYSSGIYTPAKVDKWVVERSSEEKLGRIKIWDCYGILPGTTRSSGSWYYLHTAEGDLEVREGDLESFNYYSIIPKPIYNDSTKYLSIDQTALVPRALMRVDVDIDDQYKILMYLKVQYLEEGKKVYSIIDFGLQKDSWAAVCDLPLLTSLFGEGNWENKVRGEIEKVLSEMINSKVFTEASVPSSMPKFSMDSLGMELDKILVENRKYTSPFQEDLAKIKLKARLASASLN